jgi:hypothetical protein
LRTLTRMFRLPGVRTLRASLAWGLVCACLLAHGPTAFARQWVTTATLGGRVEDASGAALRGAHVSATNLATNQSHAAASDEEGRFRFSYLPAGPYELKVEQAGFATRASRLTLSVGQALVFNVALSVAGLAESVVVTADGGAEVEAGRTQVSETVMPQEVDGLPLNGRNYLDLALLVPGVSRTNTGGGQRFAETSAVPGTGVSISGQRNLDNSFVVDGVSANDDAAGLAGTFYSQEVVREFQVVTSGGVAEFGRASAGVVNVITKSGTNDWRGRLYGFVRNQRFDARNPLAAERDPLTQAQYGASLGGPLRRDRTFLFTNFEQTRRNDAGVITIAPASVEVINARLAQAGYRGARVGTGVFASGYETTNLFARLDHKLNDANLLAARYSLYHVTSPNSRNVGALNAVSRGTGLENRDQTWTGNLVTTLSPRTLNEVRWQLTRSRLAAPVNDEAGPAVNISGVASFGTATFSPTARDLDVYEVLDNVTATRGAHALKAGADLLLNRADIVFPGPTQGVYTFSSLESFLAGRYVTFQQAFGETEQFQSNPNAGLFVQDEWWPRSDLLVSAGLRYDVQLLPVPVRTDDGNFAPRLGVAYSPGDGRTVVRAGFGLYFDRIPLRAVSNALQRDGSKYRVAVLSFGQAGAPAFPNTLEAFPAGLLASVTTIDPEIESGYSEQADVQVERVLPFDSVLSVGYTHLRGLHLVVQRNLNVPTAPAAAGLFNLGRPDPRFANVGRYESSGESVYDGLTVSFNRRVKGWAGVRVAYTLSKTTDDAGNFFFFTPQDNSNLRGEQGPSDNDQRQRLTVSGTFSVPGGAGCGSFARALAGFDLSYIFGYGSRLPFNVVTGTDRNFDTNANDRPAGVGRNSARGFDSASLDLRVGRRFKLSEDSALELLAEGFNVLNRANLQQPNNVYGTGATPRADFGRPGAADNPRQLQFGLRLDF